MTFLRRGSEFVLEKAREASSLARLWLDLAPLRKASSQPGEPRRTCLIMSNSTWGYQIRTEGMLGLALQRQGWRVVVLTSRRYWPEMRQFWCFGLKEFLFVEDLYLNSDTGEDRALDEKVVNCQTFQDLKNLRYKDAWIGPQILSSTARIYKSSALDLTDQTIRDTLRREAKICVGAVNAANGVFEKIHPDLILINEPNYAFNGALIDTAIARGIHVIQYIQTNRDDCIVFKRLNAQTRRTHPHAITPEAWSRLRDEPWTDEKESELEKEWTQRYGGSRFLQNRNQPGAQALNRSEIAARLGIDPSRKSVCVFCPVLWDANLFFGEDLFEDFSDWLIQTAKVAAETPQVDWLIKLHPANYWKTQAENSGNESGDLDLIRRVLGTIPPHIHILEPRCGISTMSLFEYVSVGVTVRGTVGMEAPCFGVPLITAGTGRYSNLGFTIDPSTPEEYLTLLRSIDQVPPMSDHQIELARKHAHAVFLRRIWTMKSFTPAHLSKPPKEWHLNVTRPRVTPTDLDVFASWAGRPESGDFFCY